jgi:GT2 family glycosyltransferase
MIATEVDGELRAGWTAVIVNYNGGVYLEGCLAALRAARPTDIVVVDNASTDDSLQELYQFPEAQALPLAENLGFAGGANAGLDEVETELAVILNPDVEVTANFGKRLLTAFALNSQLGAAGALLLYPDGVTIQHAGGVLERPLLTTRHRGYGEPLSPTYQIDTDIDFATGAALCLRTTAVREVGGFDEELAPVYYEDVDLCFRLREAGWQVRFAPELRAVHHEGVTLQRSRAYHTHFHRNRLRFALKHLSADEWRRDFVPAEAERLRWELFQELGEDWLDISGAGALDWVARATGAPDEWSRPTLLRPELAPVDQAPLEQLRESWQVEGQLLSSSVPFVGRLRNFINNLGPRWYVDQALAQQRAFNQAVVQQLEQQELRDREQTAALLLLALLSFERLRDPGAGQSDGAAEW